LGTHSGGDRSLHGATPERAPGPVRLVRVSSPAVEPSRGYSVTIGRGVLAHAAEVAWRPRTEGAARDRVALLADRCVVALHGARLGALAALPRLELDGGEDTKTLESLGEVLDFLAASGCSRRSCLVVLGGGSLGDVGGLAASLFKRGIDVVHAPSTLLALVDAAIGGKTAINLAAGKNLAGTFHPPIGVVADLDLLSTLPQDELRSGLGEVLKAALIGGERELVRLETRGGAAVGGDPDALAAIAADAAEVKARIVSEDPWERDQRRALNLGHTFGHALERAAGYGAIPHGEAVAAGLALALEASARAGVLEDTGLPARVAALATALGVAGDVAALRRRYGVALAPDAVLAAFAHDKKGAVGAPEFVLVRRAGALALGESLSPELLAALLHSPQ
jgi:3-dehydroquinate synthase